MRKGNTFQKDSKDLRHIDREHCSVYCGVSDVERNWKNEVDDFFEQP